jgi:hypothetical protein
LRSLDVRVADLSKALVAAKAKRASLALSALDGNKSAIKEVAEIDASLTAMQGETALVNDAIEQIKKLSAEQQAEAAHKQKAQREKEAEDAAASVLAIDGEIDKALAQLREMFERRRNAVQALGATGVIPSYNIGRLLQKFGPTAAAFKAGLREHLSLEPMLMQHIQTLATTDAFLRRPLHFAAQDAAPRQMESKS